MFSFSFLIELHLTSSKKKKKKNKKIKKVKKKKKKKRFIFSRIFYDSIDGEELKNIAGVF